MRGKYAQFAKMIDHIQERTSALRNPEYVGHGADLIGMIAERLTDGYKIGNKVLLKEKVTIYRFTEGAPKAETASETDSTTEEIRTADTQEEEE